MRVQRATPPIVLQTLLLHFFPSVFHKQNINTNPERSAAAVYQNIQQLRGTAGDEGLVEFIGDGVADAEQQREDYTFLTRITDSFHRKQHDNTEHEIGQEMGAFAYEVIQ